MQPVTSTRTCVGYVGLHNPGNVVRAKYNWLLELLLAEHIQRDVETLEDNAFISNKRRGTDGRTDRQTSDKTKYENEG